MKITNFKLGIGIPCNLPDVPRPFFDSYVMMDKPNFSYIPARGPSIEFMRNAIIEKAQEVFVSHLLMMDIDHEFHPKTIPTLIENFIGDTPRDVYFIDGHRERVIPRELDPKIVGALCYRRYPPFEPLMNRGKLGEYWCVEDWNDGELVEVEATGTGCLMYDMGIFDELSEPWFYSSSLNTNQTQWIIGEDIQLCHNARQKGFRIFVDTSVPNKHLSMMGIDHSAYILYKRIREYKLAHGIKTFADEAKNKHLV